MTTPTILTTPEADRDLIRSKNRGSRVYNVGGKPLPSVTSIISQGEPKPALINWAKKATAEAAIAEYDLVGQILKSSGTAAAVDHLKGAAYRQRDEAGVLGSVMHEVAEAEILGSGYPDPTEPAAAAMLGHFRHFLDTMRPTWQAVETVVFNETFGYAGTLDAIGTLNPPEGEDAFMSAWTGKPFLIDWKSGSGVYGSYALQLCAYARAEHIIGPGGPLPMIPRNQDWALVLHLRPNGWRLIPVEIGDDVWDSFLACIDMAAWAVNSDSVVGGAIAHGQKSLSVKMPEREAPVPVAAAEEFKTRRRIKPPQF